MPGTFSVPERIPRSWPPPSSSGAMRHPRVAPPHVERAHALRPVHLVRRQRRQIDRRRLDVERHLAGRLHRVGVQQRAMRVRNLRQLGQRRSTPISLFAAITLTRDRRSVTAARTASRSIEPSASTGRTVMRQPLRSSRVHVSSTDLCSVATVTK